MIIILIVSILQLEWVQKQVISSINVEHGTQKGRVTDDFNSMIKITFSLFIIAIFYLMPHLAVSLEVKENAKQDS